MPKLHRNQAAKYLSLYHVLTFTLVISTNTSWIDKPWPSVMKGTCWSWQCCCWQFAVGCARPTSQQLGCSWYSWHSLPSRETESTCGTFIVPCFCTACMILCFRLNRRIVEHPSLLRSCFRTLNCQVRWSSVIAIPSPPLRYHSSQVCSMQCRPATVRSQPAAGSPKNMHCAFYHALSSNNAKKNCTFSGLLPCFILVSLFLLRVCTSLRENTTSMRSLSAVGSCKTRMTRRHFEDARLNKVFF